MYECLPHVAFLREVFLCGQKANFKCSEDNMSVYLTLHNKLKVILAHLAVFTLINNFNQGNGKKLHNEKLRDLYSLPNIVRAVKSRRMRWAGHVARMGEGRGVHRVLVRRPEGKRLLGRPRRRWEDNIKMDLQE